MTIKRKPSDARERDLQLALARIQRGRTHTGESKVTIAAVSYTHLTLPTTRLVCRSRWSPYH